MRLRLEYEFVFYEKYWTHLHTFYLLFNVSIHQKEKKKKKQKLKKIRVKLLI